MIQGLRVAETNLASGAQISEEAHLEEKRESVELATDHAYCVESCEARAWKIGLLKPSFLSAAHIQQFGALA